MIKLTLKFTAATLLVFNGMGALYGGWHLIVHPDGSSIQLSLHYLEHSPFNNYLIPGIILFVVNGIFSFMALAAMLSRVGNYFYYMLAQGILLFSWILVQIMIMRTINFLHVIMGTAGLLLSGLALILRRMD